jgi:hypothetical protein
LEISGVDTKKILVEQLANTPSANGFDFLSFSKSRKKGFLRVTKYEGGIWFGK